MCQAYQRQYGAAFHAAMPTNLYGPGDNFDPLDSHVIPGLLRRVHEAKTQGAEEVTIWGTGTPRREFLYVEDLADACLFLMEHYDEAAIINVGVGQDLSIAELAHVVARVVGFQGRLTFDPSYPDGTPQKLLDISRLTQMGWRAQTSLETGLKETYAWFCRHLSRAPA
jgi:GDP-L-fucose synthase